MSNNEHLFNHAILSVNSAKLSVILLRHSRIVVLNWGVVRPFSKLPQSWHHHHCGQVKLSSVPLFPGRASWMDEEAAVVAPVLQPFPVHLACPLLQMEVQETVPDGCSWASTGADHGEGTGIEAGEGSWGDSNAIVTTGVYVQNGARGWRRD